MKTDGPEEVEELLKVLAEKWDYETQFITDRGWTKTNKKWKKDGFETEVWVHPTTGKEYAHISSMIGLWARAYDVAITEYIYELGWQPVLSRTEFKSKIKRHNWQRYIHPTSGDVYSWNEACMIVKEFNNDDLTCPKNRLSILTCRLKALLENYKVEKNNFILLFMQMFPDENSEVATSNYSMADNRSCHHLVQLFASEDAWKHWCKKNKLEDPEQWKQWAENNGF